jgi:hypothetical protein
MATTRTDWPPIEGIAPDLRAVPPEFHQQAWDALSRRDWLEFLVSAGQSAALALVFDNFRLLRVLDIYELALLDAYVDGKVGRWNWDTKVLHFLFQRADPQKLRAAGDPLPGPGPYTLYRGVAGKSRARRVKGISWTASLEKARPLHSLSR